MSDHFHADTLGHSGANEVADACFSSPARSRRRGLKAEDPWWRRRTEHDAYEDEALIPFQTLKGGAKKFDAFRADVHPGSHAEKLYRVGLRTWVLVSDSGGEGRQVTAKEAKAWLRQARTG